ncbi:DUF58 domain-containing protein [Litorihabitans aurantiacus]|uniref:DUF58 domain-containing protein n=1 Tax=Litorihabitans aurantiacus TaxID=1930061 RepID=A0AA38CPZ3_9MICO|nr:DUF58 domain-containing protein [Litorihabitans aurantiacus]GMA32093.1 hypothetical protein GCM10025875_20850 [Litorihabitans aurantiacus]
MRRIDWRVTARRGTTDPRTGTQLYVRRTQALAEAAVVLVVDSRDDVGADVRTWAGGSTGVGDELEPTSLDTARVAAATLARAYLEQGDRVGLSDLGARRRPLPPGTGRRQLRRLTHALARSAPAGEPGRLLRAPQVPAGALVAVCSTFLDDDAAEAAQLWAAAGHRVLALDVLAPPRLGELARTEVLAARLVLAERSARLRRMARAGVAVVPWHPPLPAGVGDGGTPDVAAHARTRLAVLARGGRS